MKKNNFLLIIFLLLGLLAGSLIGHLLPDVAALRWLKASTAVSWSPKADLDFLKYDFNIQVKLTVMNLLGLAAAIWIYRKI